MKYLMKERDYLSLVFEYISDIQYFNVKSWLDDNNHLTSLLNKQILNIERQLTSNPLIVGSYNSIDILIDDLTKKEKGILQKLKHMPTLNNINNFHIERYMDILIYIINIYQEDNKINKTTIQSIKNLIETIYKNDSYEDYLIKELDDNTKIISDNIEKFIGTPGLHWI